MLCDRSFLVPWLLGATLVACGSDPLNQAADDPETGVGGSANAGRGGSEAAGRGGSGGSSGSAGAPMIPDYTSSPCYGESAVTDVYELGTHEVRAVTATCRAEGERTRLYVTDELWEVEFTPGAPPITQESVNAFMHRFELAGDPDSYRPELGVLPTNELVFGSLAGDDLVDGKLPIFVVSSGGAGEGYLCGWCDGTQLHLDGPLLRSLNTDEALSIAAHESFHAIHRGYDPNETVWVDETIAQAAMTVNGFFTDDEWLAGFLNATNRAWGPSHDDPREFDYGAGLLFGSYLWERGGADLLRAITAEPQNSWSGLDTALASVGDPKDAWGVFLDMGVAVFLDDEESGYHFASFTLAGTARSTNVAGGTEYAERVEPYGLVYLTLDAGARGVTLESSGAVTGRIALGGTPTEVIDFGAGDSIDFDRDARVVLITAQQRADFTLNVR